MSERKTDKQRAKELGMTLEAFQSLVGYDPQELHPEFTKAGDEYEADFSGPVFETDEDVNNKNAREIEHHWNKKPSTPEEWSLYHGDHIHSKDNVFGLHAHYKGAPLGGGHTHGPQNPLGYHTHRYNVTELKVMKFARPGYMIELDGQHTHHMNAPDGCHKHSEENFGPEMKS